MTVDARASGGQPAATPDQADPRRWIALVVLLVAAFMDMLDVTIVNVALPRVQETLHAGYASIQWVTAGYALAFALLLITGGRLGDIFGRKRMFLVGMVGFTVASLLCGIAAAPWQLAAARVLEGVFAAVMIPQVLAIIHVTFPPQERGKAFGMFGAISGLAAILGMVLGGVLTQLNLFGLQWRPIFLLNIPIGIAGLIIGGRTILESRAQYKVRLDLPGVALSTAGLLLLLYPLLQGRELGWPAWGFVSMAASVVVLGVFVAYQRRMAARGGAPLLPVDLFRIRSFTSGVSVHLLFNIGMGIFFLSWALYMQLGLGWSPLKAGLSGIAFCLGAAPGAGVSVAVLAPKFGRKVLQLGTLVAVAGLGSYAWVAVHFGSEMTVWYQILPLFVFGLGFGMIAGPLPDIVLTAVPGKDAGAASGLFNTNQQLGAAIGIALASVAFFGVLGMQARANLDQVTPQLRQDLVAAGLAQPQAAAVTDQFAACAQRQADSSGSDRVACQPPDPSVQSNPNAQAALGAAQHDATAMVFAGAFRVALLGVIGGLVLAFLVMPMLPSRVVQHDQAAEGTAKSKGKGKNVPATA
jgi:EmrB/QacA subfamily drug resistance transporter